METTTMKTFTCENEKCNNNFKSFRLHDVTETNADSSAQSAETGVKRAILCDDCFIRAIQWNPPVVSPKAKVKEK